MKIRPLEVVARKLDDLVLLEPVGVLDTRSSAAFEQTILDWLRQGTTRFVVHLARVEVITSAGLRVLIMLGKRLDVANGSLVLSGLSDHVRTVFEVTALADHFVIEVSEQEAIGRIRAPRPERPHAVPVERQLADRIAGAMACQDPPRAASAGHPPATLRTLADRIAGVVRLR
jgi:anti-anti-sigma factor